MTIDDLQLAPVAANAARFLQERHPSIIFTSGRRGLRQQANAMASNIVSSRNRRWIEQTYRASEASKALQEWIDTHPQAKNLPAIAAGLEATLRALPDDVAGQISKHLSGMAFDIKPVLGSAGEKIKATIRSLPDLQKFLEREGGLIRWHLQF